MDNSSCIFIYYKKKVVTIQRHYQNGGIRGHGVYIFKFLSCSRRIRALKNRLQYTTYIFKEQYDQARSQIDEMIQNKSLPVKVKSWNAFCSYYTFHKPRGLHTIHEYVDACSGPAILKLISAATRKKKATLVHPVLLSRDNTHDIDNITTDNFNIGDFGIGHHKYAYMLDLDNDTLKVYNPTDSNKPVCEYGFAELQDLTECEFISDYELAKKYKEERWADFDVDETFRNISRRGPSHIFNDCVDLFNYIRFDAFHKLCHENLPLKLAIIQCRLARWGACAHGEKFFEDYLEDDKLKTMQKILQGMVAALLACFERSCRDWAEMNEDQRRDIENMPIDTDTKCIRDALQATTKNRLHSADLIDKTPWTIFDKGSAEILILHCVSYVDELEKRIGFNMESLEDLARVEISRVGNVTALWTLKNAARGVDNLMELLANKKYDEDIR